MTSAKKENAGDTKKLDVSLQDSMPEEQLGPGREEGYEEQNALVFFHLLSGKCQGLPVESPAFIYQDPHG